MKSLGKYFNAAYFSVLLLVAIIAGCITGYYIGATRALALKPLGDIFLNLLFTAIVPLVFFSVASATARLGATKQVGKTFFWMFCTFLGMSFVAAVYMLTIVILFPPGDKSLIALPSAATATASQSLLTQLAGMFTVTDFSQLLSHQNMLALIVFALMVGFATAKMGDKGKAFAELLQTGADIFIQVITYIMYYAPVGFFAFFAVMTAQLGPELLKNYVRIFVIYYAAATLYFVFAFTIMVYLAGKSRSVIRFWKYIWVPMLTSFATCSSAASMPANLQATQKMRVPVTIYETVIPLGTIIHKDGSVLGAIIKIAFVFGLFHLSFTGVSVLFTAIFIAMLVGTVMGAIPSGGMLGEMLILSFYGFPPQTLVIIAAISIIIDPIATMLNVTGNTVCAILVARLVYGKAHVTPSTNSSVESIAQIE